jgi:short-subunit dehydrogenase
MGFWLAGSLGTLVRIPQVLDIDQTLRLNVTAPIVHTQTLLKNINDFSKLLIVNFSSLAALQPFDCWSLYCTGKAARDA